MWNEANLDERLTALENNMLVTNSFDTGWVANSSWLDQEFLIVHNLNSNISELIIRIYISTNGTDTNSLELRSSGYSPAVATPNSYGYTIFQVTTNSFKIQTADNGIIFTADDGTADRLDSDAYYYRVKVYKPAALSMLRATLASFGSYKYSTGWVLYTSNWNSAELNIIHNLDSNLSDLIVKFFVSTDGTDTNSIEPKLINYYPSSIPAAENSGLSIFQISKNSIKIKIGADAILYIDSSGNAFRLDTEDYYYRVVVYKPDVIANTLTQYSYPDDSLGSLHMITNPSIWGVLNAATQTAFTDVNLTGIVPVGTRAVMLGVQINAIASSTTNPYAIGVFRKNGSTADNGSAVRVGSYRDPGISGTTYIDYGSPTVALDNNLIFEYRIDAANVSAKFLYATLLGYYAPDMR